MIEPWFNPTHFGAYYGAIIGGIGGSICGILGCLAGVFAPRNRARRFILGAFWTFIAFGIIQVVVGLAALWTGQPFGIWYPPLLCGIIFSIVLGFQLPAVCRKYDRVCRENFGVLKARE